MKTVNLPILDLLEYRKQQNLELFGTVSDNPNDVINIYVQATEGIIFESQINQSSKIYASIKPYLNKKIQFFDKRLVSHDFTDNLSWPSVDNSVSIFTPDPGMKLIITSIQLRFPKRIKIKETNKLYFKVYLDINGNLLPVIYLEYGSVRDLVKKTNNPMRTPTLIVNNLSSEELIEMEFRYANPDTLVGSPIILHSSKSEKIEIGLVANLPLNDVNDEPYDDNNQCWCVVNGKQTIEFG